eukprot:TRINITY_DN6108_c1_g1_i1.p1 TRINITY_DN6108_c1_g1~~TRINITY_DN6108_c1_g1_i1.p1  ORF type:complete len:221 (-),score=45.68 TRINITY_DN6108_c1_g1_i1:161-823(-)
MVLNSLSFLSTIGGSALCKVTESHTRFLELLIQYNADFNKVASIYNTTSEKAQQYFKHLKDYTQHLSVRVDIRSLNDPLLSALVDMINQIELYSKQQSISQHSAQHRKHQFSREYLYQVSSLLCECFKHEMDLDEITNYLYINYSIPPEIVNKAITYFESRNPDFFQKYHHNLQAKQESKHNNTPNNSMEISDPEHQHSSFDFPHTHLVTPQIIISPALF